MSALNKLYLCCIEEGYIDGNPKDLPITPELRQHIQSYHDDFDVRQPRFGYNPEDAELILETMQERNSPFALAVEVALRAGLRVDEIAMLRGNQVDKIRPPGSYVSMARVGCGGMCRYALNWPRS
jgi:intergrase/recombinase